MFLKHATYLLSHVFACAYRQEIIQHNEMVLSYTVSSEKVPQPKEADEYDPLLSAIATPSTPTEITGGIPSLVFQPMEERKVWINNLLLQIVIRESIDSVCRDGTDTPIA